MTNVLYQRFDTSGLAARDRFEYWRDWCAQSIDVPMRLEPAQRLLHEFHADAEALRIGEVAFVEHRSSAAVGSWTRDATVAAERLRLMMLAPTPAGIGACHGQQFSLAQGACVLVGGSDGRWQSGEGLHGMQVNVPREAVPVSDEQLAVLNDQRRVRQDAVFAGLVRPALLGLAGQLEALAHTDLRELEQLWISLLTMLTRSLAGRDTNGTDTAPARWLQIQRHIRANITNPGLSPATIAEALYISRSTLYAAVPAACDGIAAEIHRQRLVRAHAMLRDPTNTQSIAEIAASVGLANPARFSRAFRAHYGLTPRQLRADHHAHRR